MATSITKNELIDIATNWLESRKAAYLAKEDNIVYYANFTGRSTDFQWVTLTLNQLVRVLQTTVMSQDIANKMTPSIVITACQELGRVYQFGTRSPHKVVSEIFNYTSEAGQDLTDTVVYALAEEMFRQQIKVVLMHDVWDILNAVFRRLDIKYTQARARVVMYKHMPKFSYELRLNAHRPMIEGSKRPCIMMIGAMPKEWKPLDKGSEQFKNIVSIVTGEAK